MLFSFEKSMVRLDILMSNHGPGDEADHGFPHGFPTSGSPVTSADIRQQGVRPEPDVL